MFHRGWFWMDTQSKALDERIVEVVRRYGVARTGSLSQACAELPSAAERWAGMIVEVVGRDLDALTALRETSPGLPILAVIPVGQYALLDPLQALDIEVAFLPLEDTRLNAFVRRAYARSFVPSERVGRVVDHLATRAQLTAREVQLLSFCLAHESRAVIQKRLGISENTLKTQVRGLLRKCDAQSVDALAKWVLRAALMIDLHTLEQLAPCPPQGGRTHAA